MVVRFLLCFIVYVYIREILASILFGLFNRVVSPSNGLALTVWVRIKVCKISANLCNQNNTWHANYKLIAGAMQFVISLQEKTK